MADWSWEVKLAIIYSGTEEAEMAKGSGWMIRRDTVGNWSERGTADGWGSTTGEASDYKEGNSREAWNETRAGFFLS